MGSLEKNKGLVDSFLEAIRELKIKPHVEILNKVSDFVKYGVRAPGAVVINGKVVFRGERISKGKMKDILLTEIDFESL